MRILYIGGTGEISFDCVHESVRAGHDVSVFNRGNSNAGLPEAATLIRGDLHDDAALQRLADARFDVVCQFRLFSVEAIERDIAAFAGRCGQYVFISSASAYTKPVPRLPITEDTPLTNPYWGYSQAKAAMEAVLTAQSALPYTIVRPSHTYRTHVTSPLGGGIDASRLLRGRPVVVPGDGESLWTVTHARDFAPPFVKLLGNDAALGEAFHLTSDWAWPWDRIVHAVATALGVSGYELVHIPTDTLCRANPDWVGPLRGDKSVSAVFDNAKIKSVVGGFDCPTDPAAGMRLVAERHPPSADAYDPAVDALLDRLADAQRDIA